ncbi:MAG: glycosyltransferase family 4 protein [Oscillospiraceae bacterium]
MKILIATDWYKPIVNGVVTSVLNLETELRKRGHEVKVLTLSRDRKCAETENTYYLKSYAANKIYPKARVALRISDDMLDEIVRWCPDIIHTQCEFSSFHIARKIAERTGAPIVHTYHTVYEDYTHYFSPSKNLGRKAVVLFTRNILRKVDGVIAPTEKVTKILQNYGVETGIYTVPTGIDMAQFQHEMSEQERNEMKKSLGIPAENTVLLFLGRLAKEKNIEELIEFSMRLEDRNTTLLIVGGGPDYDELKKESKKLSPDTVVFTGMVPPENIAKYYQLGDVFVSASQSETQGLTYVEALASGLPALCREDDCLEGVVVDGVNGYQYSGFDEFSRRLNDIMVDKSGDDSMSKNAKRIAQDEFSSTVFAKRAEDVYKMAIKDAE